MMYTLISHPEDTQFPHELRFGDFDRRFVLRGGEPFLCVWMPEKPLWVEEDTALFGDFLLIGTEDSVHGIRLSGLSVQTFPVNLYFKAFLVHEGRLYVFDAEGIFALDEHLRILWQNRHLAVDGVLPQGMADENTLCIACEMDPPGGWVQQKIDLRNGMVVN